MITKRCMPIAVRASQHEVSSHTMAQWYHLIYSWHLVIQLDCSRGW